MLHTYIYFARITNSLLQLRRKGPLGLFQLGRRSVRHGAVCRGLLDLRDKGFPLCHQMRQALIGMLQFCRQGPICRGMRELRRKTIPLDC